MKMNAYAKEFCKKLLRTVQRRLDPNWFSRLERKLEYKIHWISPHDIRFVSQKVFHFNQGMGKILDGDWDGLDSRIEEQLDFYKAFVTKMEGRAWSETPFFQRVLSEIKSGQEKWDCRTEDELLQRFQFVDNLYGAIRELGYIPNHNHDQISVNIGRHGDLLFNDGRHRFTFAKLLDLPRIPISIFVRHREWLNFKLQILEYALQNNGMIHAPLLHPDLEWIPAHFGHKRFEMIHRALINQSGTMLDIGCHWGYFCHRFEEIGFECTGVEAMSEHFYFLKKLKRAGNKKFTIINQSISDYLNQECRRYDVALALSIFHHFIKSEKGLQRLQNLLSSLRVSEMYFLPHKPSEAQMQRAYWNPSEDEFVAFILEHAPLNRAVCLGYVENGRLLYQLTSA